MPKIGEQNVHITCSYIHYKEPGFYYSTRRFCCASVLASLAPREHALERRPGAVRVTWSDTKLFGSLSRCAYNTTALPVSSEPQEPVLPADVGTADAMHYADFSDLRPGLFYIIKLHTRCPDMKPRWMDLVFVPMVNEGYFLLVLEWL